MWSTAAVLGAVGLSLSGCGGGGSVSPTPCPSGATFPASSPLLTATGSISGKASSQGVDLDVSGSQSMWFANGNLRQDQSMTMSAQGQSLTMDQNQIQTCSNDTAHETAYVQLEGTSACSTGDVPVPQNTTCADLTYFGTSDGATCTNVVECPSGGGACAVWSVPVQDPTSFHARMFSKVKQMMLSKAQKLGSFAAAISADGAVDVYFKNGTNVVVAMKQSQTQSGVSMDLSMNFDKWDTSAKVGSDQFDVPSAWQPCTPAVHSPEKVKVVAEHILV